MKTRTNSPEIRVPAGEELDGVGKWLMKIAQNLSRKFGIPVEDAYQDCVLQYLKRRKYYHEDRGARTTFASMASGQTLNSVYAATRSVRTVQQKFDIAYTETRIGKPIPEAVLTADFKGKGRAKQLARMLQEAGWTKKEIAELREYSYNSPEKRVLCSCEG